MVNAIIKAAELESVREERERFLRAQQNADKYGIAYASVCNPELTHALDHHAWLVHVQARAV